MKLNGILVGAVIALGLAAGAVLWAALPGLRGELLAGAALGVALVAPSTLSLMWAMRRSDRMFYSVYAAGALARLGMFATAGYWVHRFTSLSFSATLLTAVGAFFFLSFVEIYLLQREASGPWNFSKS